MTEAPVVRLELPARPEGVGVVRQALVGVADGLALDGGVLSDAKMAVTEACTNAVVHAYDDEAGRLDVEMFADERALTVVVRDRGSGIQPRANRTGSTALGLGLPLIAALSDAFEVRGGPGIGTEVRMTFEYEREIDPVFENPITGGPGPTGRWELDDEPDGDPAA
jgi:anti-sigma regulatory factor (Ser/Thr protein kinase)